MKKKKEELPEFSYCIGKPWDEERPNIISTYTYITNVFHGTIEDAKNTKKFIQQRSKEKQKIYKLVEI